MAQVDSSNNPNDPENPNNPNNPNAAGNQGPQGNNQPATSSGAGGVTATGAGNVTGQVTGTANPSQPFQNIASYLSANQPQSKDLANQVAGTVSAPITDASAGITSAADKFTQSVNAGYTPENKDVTAAVAANPAYVVAENPENVTNFLANLNDKYTGPTDFTQGQGYSDLQAKIAAAQAQAANTQTPEGVQTLLKNVEGPTTAGINKFDSLLLNQNPENLKTVRDAGAPAANLLPTLNQTATDQNALAATGATNASTAAANALAALEAAHGNVSANLGDEQNTIQGIVDEYNKSIDIINPVVQNITSAIQDFLAKNPNIKFPAGTDPMVALENIASIAMPELATYASPDDYAQIAALMQLGDQNVGNLPINSSTANQAQTFNIPTQLMDALGKAPGVEAGLQSELEGFGNQINDAVKPYTDAASAAYNWAVYGQPAQVEVQSTQKQLTQAQNNLQAMLADRPYSGNYGPEIEYQKTQIQQLQQKLDAAKATLAKYPQASWDTVGPIAQGLQWVDPTETNYKSLIDSINAELGKLGSVGVPSLTYGPNTATDPVTGVPIGKVVGNEVGKSLAEGAPAAIGEGVGAGIGAGAAAAAAVPLTASELAAAAPGAVAGEVGVIPGSAQVGSALTGGLSGAAQALPPAALAAYGTSNIIKNASKDPIKAGLGTLANTGIALATLSIPPKIFTSIGKDISRVVKSIGDFFGHLF